MPGPLANMGTVELQRIVARIAPELTVRQVGELARQLEAEGYAVTQERPLSEYGDQPQPGDRTPDVLAQAGDLAGLGILAGPDGQPL